MASLILEYELLDPTGPHIRFRDGCLSQGLHPRDDASYITRADAEIRITACLSYKFFITKL